MSFPTSFFSNRWARAGLLLVAFGWGPLLGVLLLSGFGMWPDPNPNPIGCGLLFAVTFLPAVVCLAVAAFQCLRRGAG